MRKHVDREGLRSSHFGQQLRKSAEEAVNVIAEGQASDEIDDAVDDDVTDHFGNPLRQNAEHQEQLFRAQIQFTDRQAGQVARFKVLLHDQLA